MATKVCFLGGARYAQPLGATTEKKFKAMKSIAEVFVIGFSSGLHPRRFTEHAHFYLLPQLPLPFLRYVEFLVLGHFLILWLIAWHRVQVVVAQSPYEGFTAASARRIAGWLGYKVGLVVESHGDFEEGLFLQRSIPFPRLYRALMRQAARFSLEHADVLRGISDSTRRQLERWLPGKLVVQFPTWTDIEVFLQTGSNRDKQSFLYAGVVTPVEGVDQEKAMVQFPGLTDLDVFPEAGSSDSLRSILYAGVLTPLKGVHHLINAFARIANHFRHVRLVIIGREEHKDYACELREQVKRLGLEGRVQFVGAMAQAELAECMRRACMFVLPSRSEGLGRVVVEAMATSTPVIGSNVGGIPEMVEDGVTGFLVPPGDETSLADKIRWILEHPGEAYEMGTRARVFAERFFSTEAYVEGYRRLFAGAQVLMVGQDSHATASL